MCYIKKLDYLVTGTGRCGTVYMAQLLSSIGLPCLHESIFQLDGWEGIKKRLAGKEKLRTSLISKIACNRKKWIKEDEIVADSSYLAAPYLDYLDCKIIHVIREPMAVINSFVEGLKYFRDDCLIKDNFKEYHNFIYEFLPELRQSMLPVERAALYWVRWNKMIQEKTKNKSYFLFRIEQAPWKLFQFLDVNPDDWQKTGSNSINARRIYTTFDQIPSEAIRKEVIEFYQKLYCIKIM